MSPIRFMFLLTGKLVCDQDTCKQKRAKKILVNRDKDLSHISNGPGICLLVMILRADEQILKTISFG